MAASSKNRPNTWHDGNSKVEHEWFADKMNMPTKHPAKEADMSEIPELKHRPNWYPPWAPRFWNGMRFGDYWQLLKENHFRIHPTRYPMTVLVGASSVVNSALAGFQHLTKDPQIARTQLKQPPIFIVGYWRSGTTLLHELMSLDTQLAYPNNYDAFVPHHFLVSRWLIQPLVNLLMPRKRPMDNMKVQGGSPQEDEFALCALGAPSSYRRIAFPNNRNEYYKVLDANNLDQAQLADTKNAIEYFLRALTCKYDKRLVLKSPPHTGRIRYLARWFPGAKFIHLSRHPHELVPSTIRLWQTVDRVQGFQIANYDTAWMVDYVADCKDAMYAAYHRDVSSLAASDIVEVQFEELTADPLAQLARIYEQLQLPGFSEVSASVSEYFQQRKNHKQNPHNISQPLKKRIDFRWQDYMQRFGYADQQTTTAADVA